MKLKYLFGILTIFLLLPWSLVVIPLSVERTTLFYLSEIIIIGTLVFILYFYRKVIRPLDTIANGMDLLNEQDFSSRLKKVGQKEADRVVEVFNRMMVQLKEERLRLREQNHLLDLLIEVSPMGVVMLDFNHRITMANRAALRLLNTENEEELKGKLFEEISSPLAGQIALLPTEETRTVRLSDAKVYRCSHLSFIDRGFAHPFILIESLTSEVVKAEKKAYEKVIRMIAHEVNNTVAGVTSTLDTVKGILEADGKSADLCEVMSVCIERNLRMSRFITNFADVVKIPEPNLTDINLNDAVNGCRVFMETLCREKQIQLKVELDPSELQVSMDRGLFEQVLVNIIKNSAESMEGTTGTITIQTSAENPMLVIADTGKGIPQEVESKLFTPFFSTKPNGQGIGLLLIRDILDKHRCTFSLRSCPDGWTRFKISFPAAAQV